MRSLFLLICICVPPFATNAADTWQTALACMPLGTHAIQLNRTNCVDLMLRAFQSNDVVKALIFMPGATDEFYMFRRAKAVLTNDSPALLDAVAALTNQTLIHATFQPPLLLLHTDEDALDLISEIKHPPTAARIQNTQFVAHVLYNDRDWDFLLPILTKTFGVKFTPKYHSRYSWHFYRHSFAAWNLNGWEALEAIAKAGKTSFTIRRKQVNFVPDERYLVEPKLDRFPQ
jgi:hypothetical protein